MPQISATEFQYEPSRGCWWRRFLDADSDIVVAGTPAEPNAAAVELAQAASERWQALVGDAVGYISSFVDSGYANLAGAPSLVEIACGFEENVVRVSVHYESDAHGLWWVEFRAENVLGLSPYSFGRRSW
jgi:hypothetical protein